MAGLTRKLRRLDRMAPEAEAAAVKIMGATLAGDLIAMAPRDTNRYVRGWVDAGNASGVGLYPKPVLQESRFRSRMLDRIELQRDRTAARLQTARKSLQFWENMLERRYLSKGRADKWARDCQRKVDVAMKRVEKLTDLHETAAEIVKQLKADPYALVIWGRRTKSDTARSQLATVRDKEYGGTGKVLRIGERTFVQLHNLEPHATIVEARYRVVARATARTKRIGGKRASKRFLEKVRAEARVR